MEKTEYFFNLLLDRLKRSFSIQVFILFNVSLVSDSKDEGHWCLRSLNAASSKRLGTKKQSSRHQLDAKKEKKVFVCFYRFQRCWQDFAIKENGEKINKKKQKRERKSFLILNAIFRCNGNSLSIDEVHPSEDKKSEKDENKIFSYFLFFLSVNLFVRLYQAGSRQWNVLVTYAFGFGGQSIIIVFLHSQKKLFSYDSASTLTSSQTIFFS